MNPYISIENSLNKVYIFVQIGLLGCNYVDTIESFIWKRVNFNFALRANTNTMSDSKNWRTTQIMSVTYEL